MYQSIVDGPTEVVLNKELMIVPEPRKGSCDGRLDLNSVSKSYISHYGFAMNLGLNV